MTDALNRLWTDTLTVGRTGTVYPCRLSRQKAGAPYTEYTDIHEPRPGYIVYCAPDTDVRAGDLLTVRRGAHTFRGYAGKPMPYASHLEVEFTDTEAV